MKVLIALKTNVGGLWILPHIHELQGRGHDVAVVIPQGDGRLRQRLDADGVRVIPTRFDFSLKPHPRTVRGVAEVRQILRKEKADVLMYHLIAAALVCRITSWGLRNLRTVHMVPGPLYLESKCLAAAEAVLSRFDDHLIAGSDYTKKKYQALRYPARRLSAVAYGVDTRRFVRGKDRRTDLIEVSADTFVAVMVAYVYAPKSAVFPGVGIKGHETMLAAWDIFHSRHPKSQLVLVGAGFNKAGEAHRERLLAEYGDQAGVTWIESVEDVRPYYSSADVSVSPSLSENHGAALEASAMEVPSIVSDAGGLPEAVTPESGWIVPAGRPDELVAALESSYAEYLSGSLHHRGIAARQHAVAHFDAQAMAARVADVVQGHHQKGMLVVAEQRCGLGAGGAVMGAVELKSLRGSCAQHNVRLLVRQATDQPQGTSLMPGATGVLVPWRGGLDVLRGLGTILREVRSTDITVVFAPGSIGSLAGLTALALRRPLAVVAVGDPGEALRPPVTRGLRGAALRWVLTRTMKLLCRRADLVRYVTGHVLQERYPSSGVSVSASDAFPMPTRGESSPALQQHSGPLVVLTVASLDQPYKGVADLIEAVEDVRRSGLDAELVVVGAGRLRPDLEATAKAMLGDSARFTGQLSGEDLVSAYLDADLFVLASWSEGMPRALLEAMSMQIPCVATRVGGVVEILPDSSLAAPREPASLAHVIKRLLTDAAARSAAVEHASSTVVRIDETSREGHSAFLARLSTLVRTPAARDNSEDLSLADAIKRPA